MLSMACSALLHLGNMPSGKAPEQCMLCIVQAPFFKVGLGEYRRSGERVSAACLRYTLRIEVGLKEIDAHLTRYHHTICIRRHAEGPGVSHDHAQSYGSAHAASLLICMRWYDHRGKLAYHPSIWVSGSQKASMAVFLTISSKMLHVMTRRVMLFLS